MTDLSAIPQVSPSPYTFHVCHTCVCDSFFLKKISDPSSLSTHTRANEINYMYSGVFKVWERKIRRISMYMIHMAPRGYIYIARWGPLQ